MIYVLKTVFYNLDGISIGICKTIDSHNPNIVEQLV